MPAAVARVVSSKKELSAEYCWHSKASYDPCRLWVKDISLAEPKIQGSCMRNLDLPKMLPTAVVAAFILMIWFVIPAPAGVSLNAWHLFALFVGTIVGIISNAMPLGAISIVAIALVAVTEVTNPGKPAAAVVDALSGFANPLIWLIVIAV